jgi:hypothetical protein
MTAFSCYRLRPSCCLTRIQLSRLVAKNFIGQWASSFVLENKLLDSKLNRMLISTSIQFRSSNNLKGSECAVAVQLNETESPQGRAEQMQKSVPFELRNASFPGTHLL